MQKYIFPLLVFLIGFYLVGLRLVGIDFDGIPGDMGDGRLNNYFLEHGYLYLTGSIDSYWNAPFFYPEKSTMSMSDNLFGTLPLYALFRAMSFDRETAYQIWFLCLLALNFISAYVCLRKLKTSPVAASIGAYIFAFSLAMVGGIGHVQMLPKFVFPVIIYCLIRFMQDKKPKHLFFFFLLNVYQMYCGIYLGFMAILSSLLVFGIMIFMGGFKTELKLLGGFLRRNWVSTFASFILNLSLLFILLRPYILRSGNVERDYGDIGEGLPTPLSYLYPSSNSLLYEWMRPLGKYLTNPHEHTLWMGLSCLLAVALGIYLVKSKKDKQVKFWLISFLMMLLITLNFYGHVSFYAVVYFIPGFEAIRAVSRIVQIELFFLGGLVAVVVDRLIKKEWSSSRKTIVMTAIVLFVLVDQFEFKSGLNSHSKMESQQRVSILKTKTVSRYEQSSNFKEFPSIPHYYSLIYLPENDFEVYKFHMDAMLAAQDLRIKTINGYSAFSPNQFEDFFAHPNRDNFEMLLEKDAIPHKTILVIED